MLEKLLILFTILNGLVLWWYMEHNYSIYFKLLDGQDHLSSLETFSHCQEASSYFHLHHHPFILPFLKQQLLALMLAFIGSRFCPYHLQKQLIVSLMHVNLSSALMSTKDTNIIKLWLAETTVYHVDKYYEQFLCIFLAVSWLVFSLSIVLSILIS